LRKPTSNIRLKPATVELLNKVRGPVTQDYLIAALLKAFIKSKLNFGDLLMNEEPEEENE